MDDVTREFIRRCDQLMQATERQRQDWLQEGQEYRARAAQGLVVAVQRLRQQAVDGTLRRPSGGVGWGITREVGEWGDETELHELSFQLEELYRTKM